VQPQRADSQPPLPIGIHCAILPIYAALHFCGNKPLCLMDFISPPSPAPKEVEMASAVSTNDPARAARKALSLLPHNLFFTGSK
jgi:hypothetical protein